MFSAAGIGSARRRTSSRTRSRNRRPERRFVPAERHRASQNDAIRVDRVHQRDDADSQIPGRFQHDFQRQCIARFGLFADQQRRKFRSALPTCRSASFAAGVERLLGPFDDGRRTGIGLEMTRDVRSRRAGRRRASR